MRTKGNLFGRIQKKSNRSLLSPQKKSPRNNYHISHILQNPCQTSKAPQERLPIMQRNFLRPIKDITMIMKLIIAMAFWTMSIVNQTGKTDLHIANPSISQTNNNCTQTPPTPIFQDLQGGRAKNTKKQFQLTPKGIELIKQMRQKHKASNIMPPESKGKNLCAGYIFELSAVLRGPEAPTTIGMLHPKTRSPADARELPYTYRYRGANISYDIGNTIGKQLAKDPKQYRSRVSTEDIVSFFAAAFSEANRLSDIGFLYNQTNYGNEIGSYWNYNSHIAKNMGTSDFEITIQKSDMSGNQESTILNALQCDQRMEKRRRQIMSHYKRRVNNSPAYIDSTGQWRKKDGVCYSTYTLQQGDKLSYQDITLAHFFETERIDSLLQLVCKGEFAPINVININSKFLEIQ